MADKIFGERLNNAEYYDRKGAYLIAIENNKLAVVKTSKGYFLLGGGFNEQENHIDCIKRECLEEIGCDVVVKDYICCAEEYCFQDELGYFHPIQFYYLGNILNNISEPVETNHIFEWISLDNIEEKMYVKAQGWAVKNYLANCAGRT